MDVAWDIFLDFESWGMRRKIYERIEWISGAPWAQNSRARLHQLWPVKQTVLIRVMQSHKPDLLTALYHAGGLTSTKHVRLRMIDTRMTEVKIETEILGESLDPELELVDEMLRLVYEQTLADFADECRARYGQLPERAQSLDHPSLDKRNKTA